MMKKSLFSLSLAFLGFAASSNAQVIYSENFDAATPPALPSGWAQVLATPGASGWVTGSFSSFSANWGTATGTTPAAHASQIAFVNDWDAGTTAPGASNTDDMLTSASFSLAGTTAVWLNYEYFFYKAVTTGTPSYKETCFVMGSTNGGATWTVIDSLDGIGWDEAWVTGHTNLTAALGSTSTNCMIGFQYKDGGGKLLGAALDNIEIVDLNTSKAATTLMGYNSITNGVSINGESIAFLAQNNGLPITSFDAQYTINGGTPVTQTFTPSPSLAPYASAAYSFTTPMAGLVAGTNTVVVTITAVNGTANTDTDPSETSTFVMASASTTRQGLVEEFSSSTCPPCASFNAIYDPLCAGALAANTTGSNFNIIKYQMNWPNPGTDRSYNADGASRRGYYGVSSIPDHFVNGRPSVADWTTADLTTEANNSKALDAFIDMAVTYKVDTVSDNMYINVKVTPRFTKTAGYHVYVALADKHYQNTTHTTGQLEYYHVMRKMLPNGNGTVVTSMTDGTTQNYNFFFKDSATNYTLGAASYPTQFSNMFWNNPLTGSELIAFVEEDGTKSVMQSILAFPVPTLEVSTLSRVTAMNVYPNPVVNGLANVSFNLEAAGNVQVKVMDFTGKVVSEVISKEMNIGTQTVALPIGNIAAGNYVVVVSTPTGNNAAPLTVK